MKPQYDVHHELKLEFKKMFDKNFEKSIVSNVFRCNVCFFIKTFVKDFLYFPLYNGKFVPIMNYQNVKLRRCSSCKTMKYCSEEHQKLHWKHHKEICGTFKKLFESRNSHCFLNQLHSRFLMNQLNSYIPFLDYIIDNLKRNYISCEIINMIVGKTCKVCNQFGIEASNVICKKCERVMYCDNDCKIRDKQSHKSLCESYITLFNFYRTDMEINLDYENSNKNLSKTKNLIDFLKNYGCNININIKPKTQDEFTWLNAVSKYSNITTILFCLQYCEILNKNDKLIIHIYCSINEMYADFNESKLKLLLSQTPNVKKITFIFITYSVEHIPTKLEKSSIKLRNKKISVEKLFIFQNHRGSISLRADKNPNLTDTPNLVFYNDWMTIDWINLNYKKTIIAVTTLSLEFSRFLVDQLQSYEMTSIVENSMNPYRSLIPRLDPHGETGFSNYYLSILKTLK